MVNYAPSFWYIASVRVAIALMGPSSSRPTATTV